MKRIFLVLLSITLLFTLLACETNKYEIKGVSKEFSSDFNEVLKVIEKDIKNHSNESSIYIPDRIGYNFIKKYEDRILTENEQKIFDIIKESLILRSLGFIVTNKEEFKYNEEYDKECIEILKEADIIVTNPPFSLFREYVAQLMEYDKKFVILGNQNALTNKDIFELIKKNKIWLGIESNGRKCRCKYRKNKYFRSRFITQVYTFIN